MQLKCNCYQQESHIGDIPVHIPSCVSLATQHGVASFKLQWGKETSSKPSMGLPLQLTSVPPLTPCSFRPAWGNGQQLGVHTTWRYSFSSPLLITWPISRHLLAGTQRGCAGGAVALAATQSLLPVPLSHRLKSAPGWTLAEATAGL